MITSLSQGNKNYWQNYKPGQIPTVPQELPERLLKNIETVLDIGTGDGVLAEKLAGKGYKTYGIDIAENIIRENKKRGSSVKYSVQDITKKTNFPSLLFDLVVFRFTLTNIHKESWRKVGDEVHRLLKPNGKVWILEPLVSESYNKRYKLASYFIKDKHCVYVFFDKDMAERIKTKFDLKRALKEGRVSRIVKHYQVEELEHIFKKLTLTNSRIIGVESPSGYKINTFEGVFTKIHSPSE